MINMHVTVTTVVRDRYVRKSLLHMLCMHDVVLCHYMREVTMPYSLIQYVILRKHRTGLKRRDVE